MNNQIGLVFPAFAMAFSGSMSNYEEERSHYITLANRHVEIDVNHFEKIANGTIDDELQAHYFSYINSCIISDEIKKNNINPEYIAGYSMGLFATLYHASVVSFGEGLVLMDNTYGLALDSVDVSKKFSVGAIIGLTYQNIESIILENFNNLDIIDIGNDHVITVSGVTSEVIELLAKVEGEALRTRLLPIQMPYHSRFMEKLSDKLRIYISKIDLSPPENKIISCIDQKILTTVDDVKNELCENVRLKMNWHKTMQTMISLDTTIFVECGMTNNLNKLAKFYQEDFEFYTIRNLDKLFDAFEKFEAGAVAI